MDQKSVANKFVELQALLEILHEKVIWGDDKQQFNSAGFIPPRVSEQIKNK